MLVMPPSRLAGIDVGLQATVLHRGHGLVGGEEVGATGFVVDAIVLVEDVRLGHLHAGRAHCVRGHTDAGDGSRVGRQISATRWRRRWSPARLRLQRQRRTILLGVQRRANGQGSLLGYGHRIRGPVGIVPQIANRVLHESRQRGRVDPEVGVRIIQVREQEHGHPVRQDPHVLVLVDLDVGGKDQAHIIPIHDPVELR